MPVLAVATPGGHLDELHTLVDRFAPKGSPLVWVTAATAQSQSLLAGETVEWVRAVGPRQVAAASLPGAVALMRRYKPSLMISTGAALSVPYLMAARSMGVETHFVESATRLKGPSLTGRIVERVPGVQLYCQSGGWDRRKWQEIDSVFTSYSGVRRRAAGSPRIVVMLGSERFPFPRAVEAVAAALPPSADVVWQLGNTAAPRGLQGEVHRWLPFNELKEEAERADVVVTHCGVGSVLMALRAGKCPVVIPRLRELGEHVDGHQMELARNLEASGLAFVATPQVRDVRVLLQASAAREAVLLAGVRHD